MSHTFRELLEKITSVKAPGPSPTFSVFHILRAMELIYEREIGRSKLAEKLNVGEGSVRTIVARFKDAGLIKTSKAGCALTGKGSRLWKEYKSVFKKKMEIGKSELALANYSFAILIKNRGDKVKSGVEQRDAAVMAGAKAATTIVFKEDRLIIPSVSNNVGEDFPEAANLIIRHLEPEENDVIVIGSADTLGKAEYGTLAAAWTLFNGC